MEREFAKLVQSGRAPELVADNAEDSAALLHNMKVAVLRFSGKLAFGMFLHGQVRQVRLNLQPTRPAATATSAAATAAPVPPKPKVAKILSRAEQLQQELKQEQRAAVATHGQSSSNAEVDDWAQRIFFGDVGQDNVLHAEHLCSPLRRSDNEFQFLHKSVQEYLAALHLAHELQEAWLEPPGSRDSQRAWVRDPAAVGALALAQKPLTHDVAILRFAAALVHPSVRTFDPDEPTSSGATAIMPPFGRALWDVLYASRRAVGANGLPMGPDVPEPIRKAAANAMSILNCAGVPFCNRALRGLVLGHANERLADMGTDRANSAAAATAAAATLAVPSGTARIESSLVTGAHAGASATAPASGAGAGIGSSPVVSQPKTSGTVVPYVADLHGADLSAADLTGAYLWNVRLQEAQLDGASLLNAVFDCVFFGEYPAFRNHDGPVRAIVIDDSDTVYSVSESSAISGYMALGREYYDIPAPREYDAYGSEEADGDNGFVRGSLLCWRRGATQVPAPRRWPRQRLLTCAHRL
jgi:hypothetical protein